MHRYPPVFIVAIISTFLSSVSLASAADDPSKLEFRLGNDAEIADWKQMDLPGSETPIFVSPEPSLNGTHIEEVSFSKDDSGNSVIGFTLTEDGGKLMKATTTENLNKRLVILLNGEVVSAPIIRSVITQEGVITGNFDKDDLLAFFHAIVLRQSP